jgi:D-glycero-D-manno-heptose 1,7-bisphosphate phosphatase
VRFVILDRDGTIIEERDHLAAVEGVRLIPGAAAAIRSLRDAGLGVVVVTNQSVIGRGMLDESGLEAIHERMRELLAAEGGRVDAIYHCPHLPGEGCTCRKPATGLVERAAAEHGFDPGETFLVGDHASDVELGRRIGATTIHVLTGHGAEERDRATPDRVAADLSEAAAIIRGILSGEAT